MTTLHDIESRLTAAEYAVKCAKGGGAFGSTEQAMIQELQEHAIDDLRFLLRALAVEIARADGLDAKAARSRESLKKEVAALREKDRVAQLQVEEAKLRAERSTEGARQKHADYMKEVEANAHVRLHLSTAQKHVRALQEEVAVLKARLPAEGDL